MGKPRLFVTGSTYVEVPGYRVSQGHPQYGHNRRTVICEKCRRSYRGISVARCCGQRMRMLSFMAEIPKRSAPPRVWRKFFAEQDRYSRGRGSRIVRTKRGHRGRISPRLNQ